LRGCTRTLFGLTTIKRYKEEKMKATRRIIKTNGINLNIMEQESSDEVNKLMIEFLKENKHE